MAPDVPFSRVQFQLSQDVLDHLFVFQADGQEDCFNVKGMGLVDCGVRVELCPVEEP
jgi:hypothetical protein